MAQAPAGEILVYEAPDGGVPGWRWSSTATRCG